MICQFLSKPLSYAAGRYVGYFEPVYAIFTNNLHYVDAAGDNTGNSTNSVLESSIFPMTTKQLLIWFTEEFAMTETTEFSELCQYAKQAQRVD